MRSTETGWGAVVIGGSEKGLRRTGRRLERLGYRLFQTSRFRAVLDDVRGSSMEDVERIADDCGCSIDALHEPKEVDLPRTRRARRRCALRLSLEPGKWYFAENAEEIFPLMLVRDAKIEKVAGEDGEQEVQTFVVELLGPEDGIPYRIEADSRIVSRWGLRPATSDDFDELDIVPPTMGELVVTAVNHPRLKAEASRGLRLTRSLAGG